MDVKQYKQMLHNLLPSGLAWPKRVGSDHDALLEAGAVEFTRVDDSVKNLLIESFPGTATDLLPDWERITGLPDECAGEIESITQRRNFVLEKLSSSGGQNHQFYIDAAARLGYTITINEYKPARVGELKAGDPINGKVWAYVWQVIAPQNTINYFRVGANPVGEALATWGNDDLECIINNSKPAHTRVLYSYV